MQDTLPFIRARQAYWNTPAEAKITGQHISPSDRLEAAIRAWEDAKAEDDLPEEPQTIPVTIGKRYIRTTPYIGMPDWWG